MDCHQTIYTRDGNFEKATDLVVETFDQIITACQTGTVSRLKTILNSIESDKRSYYLNAFSNLRESNKFSHHLNTPINLNIHKLHFTPLMIASMYGHDSIVQVLLTNYSHYCIVDAQNYSSDYDGSYQFYDEHFNKQTALWLAVEFGHLNVVKSLISFGKANINHKADFSSSESNWTPLGIACKNGQLEMVKYLIENGADLYNIDNNDSTVLMIACRYGQYEIVKYLLSLDDSNHHLLNAINSKGSTALHQVSYTISINIPTLKYSFESNKTEDRRLDIVKLLLEKHQAKIVKDKDGYTPLTIAGINNDNKLVKYFMESKKQSSYLIIQIIDELEIIGSHHLISNYWIQSNFEKSYYYLLWAMQLRYSNPKKPILKTNLLSPIEAYGCCKECETIEELQMIKNDRDRMILEGFMIRERFGVTSKFLFALNDYAERCSHRDYGRSFHLYFHVYRLRIKKQIGLHKCIDNLQNCVLMLNKIIDNNETIKQTDFDLFTEILQATKNEYIRNRNFISSMDIKTNNNRKLTWLSNQRVDMEKYNADKCLYLILNLLFIGTKILKENSKEETERRKILFQHIHQIINSNWCTLLDNKTLLHLALLPYHNYFDLNIVTEFPSLPVVKLLLSCGAAINATDSYHNTPLHELARNEYEDSTDEQLKDIEIIFKLLVNNGAHFDAMAQRGIPETYAKHPKLKALFRTHTVHLNLKCACAHLIQRNKLDYTDRIPKHLHSFVQLH